MRFSPLFGLLLLALVAQAQERVAILNTVDDRDSISVSDLTYLTNRLRETAVKVLPKSRFGVMTTESIVAFLGSQENARKACNEASCLAEVGRKVSADYVAQARIGRFSNQLSINFQLYSSKSGNLIDSFTGNSNDIFGLLATIDEKAPDLFKQMLEESKPQKAEPIPEVEKPVEVEKPEFAKLEPEPKPKQPEPEKPNVENSSKASFWVAIGLDVLGVALITYAINKNQEMNDAYDRYSIGGESPEYYKAARKDVDSAKSSRNMFYTVGGLLLASGIGVHICF